MSKGHGSLGCSATVGTILKSCGPFNFRSVVISDHAKSGVLETTNKVEQVIDARLDCLDSKILLFPNAVSDIYSKNCCERNL